MKYRKKPIIIEAVQYKSMQFGIEDSFHDLVYGTISDAPTLAAVHSWYGSTIPYEEVVKLPCMDTLEGRLYISKDDYIITGISGERYPCKPGIFEATYEPVQENKE